MRSNSGKKVSKRKPKRKEKKINSKASDGQTDWAKNKAIKPQKIMKSCTT
jgi:hypothetical protein